MKGLTLVELLIVIGIATILLGLTTINLVRVQQNTSLGAVSDILIADLKSQQMKAMSGANGGGSFGIHFTSSNSYTLFKGSNYVPPGDFTVTLEDPISVSTTYPGNEIVFSKTSGEVDGEHTITITNSAGGEQQTLTVNKLGVVKDVN
ncbi:hypothetical protein HYT18_05305 [Candidatus Microgenomates bacterium]|nr:hypothetical protein [Candidatus Microgenomates bacterium]